METLKGLDLVENVTKPVPDTVTSYYKNTECIRKHVSCYC